MQTAENSINFNDEPGYAHHSRQLLGLHARVSLELTINDPVYSLMP